MFLDDKIENNSNYFYQFNNNQILNQNAAVYENKKCTNKIFSNDNKSNYTSTDTNIIEHKKIHPTKNLFPSYDNNGNRRN